MEPLHIAYRPKHFAEVIGQDPIVKSLQKVSGSRRVPHSFLFSGASGCGKTTLARIVAYEVGCLVENVVEIDAATNTGIDAMRMVTDSLKYRAFGATSSKMIIIDEAHALSKAAWQSLLKSVEEPPPHVFFAFCTTELGKVPDTIVTRCCAYNLAPIKTGDVLDLLMKVCEKESDISVSESTLRKIASACNGSARQALVMLSKVRGLSSAEDIEEVLETAEGREDIIQIARGIISGKGNFVESVRILSKAENVQPESVRIVLTNYFAAVLMKAPDHNRRSAMLDALHALSKPMNPSDKMAPLLLALAAIYRTE